MWFGLKSVCARFTPRSDNNVGLFVGPDWDVVSWDIGHSKEETVELLFYIFNFVFEHFYAFPYIAHFLNSLKRSFLASTNFLTYLIAIGPKFIPDADGLAASTIQL
tara:strand:+ start:486 stop:803 length:318 start_codon:yes stop_codon:yes gene_type:complete